MRRNLSYPKDNEDKVRESNKQLRAQIKRLRKENEMLRRELENIEKPARVRKEPVVTEESQNPEKFGDEKSAAQKKEEWRKNFVKEFKPKGKK